MQVCHITIHACPEQSTLAVQRRCWTCRSFIYTIQQEQTNKQFNILVSTSLTALLAFVRSLCRRSNRCEYTVLFLRSKGKHQQYDHALFCFFLAGTVGEVRVSCTNTQRIKTTPIPASREQSVQLNWAARCVWDRRRRWDSKESRHLHR